MSRLFLSLGAALENALTSECFCCCFLGQHWRCEDEIGWQTVDDALEGSGVLGPEGTGSCAVHAAVQSGWRTVDDALEGSGVLGPEGTGGCAVHAAVQIGWRTVDDALGGRGVLGPGGTGGCAVCAAVQKHSAGT